jgi:hypothetical protein
MSLLDEVETNKELEQRLDEIVRKKLQDHYDQADQTARVIRQQFHDPVGGNQQIPSYRFYEMENRNLQESLSNALTGIRTLREETAKLYSNKTVLLRLIAELYHILDFNLTKPQMQELTQLLKHDLDEIDFTRVKVYKRQLGQ